MGLPKLKLSLVADAGLAQNALEQIGFGLREVKEATVSAGTAFKDMSLSTTRAFAQVDVAVRGTAKEMKALRQEIEATGAAVIAHIEGAARKAQKGLGGRRSLVNRELDRVFGHDWTSSPPYPTSESWSRRDKAKDAAHDLASSLETAIKRTSTDWTASKSYPTSEGWGARGPVPMSYGGRPGSATSFRGESLVLGMAPPGAGTDVDKKGFWAGASGALDSAGLGALKNPYVQAAAAGAMAIRAGASLEKSMSSIRAVTRGGADDMKQLKQQVMDLARETQFSPTEIAEGFVVLAQQGLSTKDIIKASEPVYQMATAGHIEMAEAARFSGQTLMQFGLTSKDLPRVADVMSTAIAGANFDMENLKHTLELASPVAKMTGHSLEEVAAMAMMLANSGIRGELAGTSLRNMMYRTTHMSREAKQALEFLGVTFQDAHGNAKNFGVILDELNAAMKRLKLGTSDKMDILGQIFSTRAASGMIVALEKGGDEYRRLEKDVKGGKGRAAEMADINLDNTAGSWKKFLSSLEMLGVGLFDMVSGPLQFLVDAMNTAAKAATWVLQGALDYVVKPAWNFVKDTASSVWDEVWNKGVRNIDTEHRDTQAGNMKNLENWHNQYLAKQQAELEARQKAESDEGKQKIELRLWQDKVEAIKVAVQHADKYANAALSARGAADQLFLATVGPHNTFNQLWQRTLEQTKEFEGVMSELQRDKGATPAELTNLKAWQDASRGQIFQRLVAEHASRVWEGAKEPADKFADTIADLNQLLGAGWLSWDKYEKSVRNAGKALQSAEHAPSVFAGAALMMGSAGAASAINASASRNASGTVQDTLTNMRDYIRQLLLEAQKQGNLTQAQTTMLQELLKGADKLK